MHKVNPKLYINAYVHVYYKRRNTLCSMVRNDNKGQQKNPCFVSFKAHSYHLLVCKYPHNFTETKNMLASYCKLI